MSDQNLDPEADETTEESATFLRDHIAGARVLLLVTHRPEFVSAWSRKSYHSTITLTRLSRRECHDMLIALLGSAEIREALVELVIDHAAGTVEGVQVGYFPDLYAALAIHADPTAKGLPSYVRDACDASLQCGILAQGFLRLGGDTRTHKMLLACSGKKRGFCPSCAGRRMAEMAAHLVDQVIPWVATPQWVVPVPMPWR